LVQEIYAVMDGMSSVPGGNICDRYLSGGTSYSQYNILMKGDDGCCVVSSHMTQKCK
jgi:hypothetical protein